LLNETKKIPDEILEMKKDYVGAIIKAISPLMDVERCSSWMKLVRRTAQVIRFLRLCLKKRAKVKVGRHHEKRYGVLFTCLATREVHLEIAHSLSTDACIMALRFFGRIGCPKVIWSDNGTNFRGAATELKKALLEIDQSKIRDQCLSWG